MLTNYPVADSCHWSSIIAVLPGIPALPFLILAGVTGGIASLSHEDRKRRTKKHELKKRNNPRRRWKSPSAQRCKSITFAWSSDTACYLSSTIP